MLLNSRSITRQFCDLHSDSATSSQTKRRFPCIAVRRGEANVLCGDQQLGEHRSGRAPGNSFGVAFATQQLVRVSARSCVANRSRSRPLLAHAFCAWHAMPWQHTQHVRTFATRHACSSFSCMMHTSPLSQPHELSILGAQCMHLLSEKHILSRSWSTHAPRRHPPTPFSQSATRSVRILMHARSTLVWARTALRYVYVYQCDHTTYFHVHLQNMQLPLTLPRT